MEYTKGAKGQVIAVLDRYHVDGTISLPELVDKILSVPALAAAPDLYEACLDMETFIQTWKDVLLTNMTEDMLQEATKELYQAIAKVEGK